MLQWIKRIPSYLWSFKSKDLSLFQRYWPELLRVFILLNYLYFTYFLFSLTWAFIRHSVLQKHQQPCKILDSLQILRQFNGNLQTFWKEQFDVFYNSLVNVCLMYFQTSGNTEHLDANSVETKAIENLSDVKGLQKEEMKCYDRSKSDKWQKSKCKLYDMYNAKITTRNLFDAKEEKVVKINERTSKRKTNIRSDLKVEKECADCNKIRLRAAIQLRSKNKYQNQGDTNEELCKVIYYGPYACKKRSNTYTQQGIGNIIENTNGTPKERNKKYSTNSTEICRTKLRVNVCKKDTGKHQREKVLSMKERERKYSSQDEPTSFHSKGSFPGTPLSRIDPNDGSFMTNSSIKHFYKKLKTRSKINVNHSLRGAITDALRRVSKSVKPETKIYRIFK